jgi:cell pole-organizing protein PopZ
MELVSQREYARRHNWNPGYVAKLKASGRLVLESDGKGGHLVNVEASDAKLDATRDPTRDYMADVNARQRELHNKPAAAEVAAAAAAAPSGGGGTAGDLSSAGAVAQINQRARAQALVWDAKTKQLQYEKAAGKLVDADTVKAEAFNRARIARKSIEAIADRLAPKLAVETHVGRVYELLIGEFRKVFDQLSAGLVDPASRDDTPAAEQ